MNLKLSPLQEKDFDTLIRWAENPKELLLWAGPALKYPLSYEQLSKYLTATKGNNPKMFVYKSQPEGSDDIAGMAELNSVDRINGTATLCRIFVDKSYRGRGIAENMIKQVLKVGFADLMLRRIDLRVYSVNTNAIRCYEKIGFVKEGNLREFTRFENEYWAVLIYSILKSDWEKLNF